MAALTQDSARARPGTAPARSTAQGAASVPAKPATAKVKVVDSQGALADRVVEVGVSNRVQAQVLSGLEQGERVVSGRSTSAGAGRPPMSPRL